jgi:hypothetical protein
VDTVCALDKAGSVSCVGATSSAHPVKIKELTNAVLVRGSRQRLVCALQRTGSAACVDTSSDGYQDQFRVTFKRPPVVETKIVCTPEKPGGPDVCRAVSQPSSTVRFKYTQASPFRPLPNGYQNFGPRRPREF